MWYRRRSSRAARFEELQKSIAGATAAAQEAHEAVRESVEEVRRAAQAAEHSAAAARQAATQLDRSQRPKRNLLEAVSLSVLCVAFLLGALHFARLVPPAFTDPSVNDVA